METILKIGLVATNDEGHLLVVRKHGGVTFILPGGKPEDDETDLQTLGRELSEELGVTLAPGAVSMGSFGAIAADMPTHMVMVRTYRGTFIGEPSPQAEIAEMRWIDPTAPDVPIAESISNGILLALRKR